MLVMMAVRAMRTQMLRARGTTVYEKIKRSSFPVLAPIKTGIGPEYLASEERWEGTGGVWSLRPLR